MEVIDDLVHQHPVAHVEGRQHRLGRDVEGLHQEALDEEGQQERDHQQGRELGQEVGRLSFLPSVRGGLPGPGLGRHHLLLGWSRIPAFHRRLPGGQG